MEHITEFRVRQAACIGCGLCAESCPQQAISVQRGQAHIEPGKCRRCGLCLDVCPQGAIVELVPVAKEKLEATVTSLMQKTNELIERIESLKR